MTIYQIPIIAGGGMGLVIQGNLLALNASNNIKINTGSRAKSAERLSSGFRINRAADDAAGLSISEKMRRQIRGLDQGARNAQDGISFTQIGDGALNEAHDMLHRMEELSVKAANGTLSASDRADVQAEFRQLQTEIDHVTDTSIFNETHVFAEHEPTFHAVDGGKVWDQGHTHVIDDENDSWTFVVQKDDNSPEETYTIQIQPHGNYTTAELNSAIDDALIASGAADAGIEVVYKMDGTFDVSYEGGEKLKSLDGGLSYLLYDLYNGASTGALIGTTIFTSESARLPIVAGQNDNLSFDIVDFSGGVTTKNITLPAGRYTRQQIMDMLNNSLSDTSVTAVAKGTGIKLQTNDAVITRFKGNMFKIEERDPIYTSVFYDNVKYGQITAKSAEFNGGYVLDTSGNALQAEFSTYHITSDNNTLSFKPDSGDTIYTITIPNGDYTLPQMTQQLNNLLSAQGTGITASVIQSGSYGGIRLTSSMKGAKSDVGVIDSSSAYDTLFINRNKYSEPASGVSHPGDSPSKDATFTSANNKISTANPLVVEGGVNDQFKIMDGSDGYTVTLTAKTYTSAAALATEINARVAELPALSGRVTASVYSNAVRLTGPCTVADPITDLSAAAVSGNTGYSDIFVGKNVSNVANPVSGTGSVRTGQVVSDPATITSSETTFRVRINGGYKSVSFPAGSYSHDEIIEKINNALQSSGGISNNTFSTVSDTGEPKPNPVTSTTAAGNTNLNKATYEGNGTYEAIQGSTKPKVNTPAKITVSQVNIPANTVIGNDNDTIKLTLNDVTKTLTLDHGVYGQSELVAQIQSKLNEAYAGTPGATVGITNNHLTFTGKLDDTINGNDSNLKIIAMDGGSFIIDLHTTKTAGTATSSRTVQSSFSVTDATKDFTFTVNGNTYTVELPAANYTRQSFVNKLNELISSKGATASLDSTNKLVLTTTGKGQGQTVNYSSNIGANSSADVIFGPTMTYEPASITPDRNLQSSITIAGDANKLRLKVNGQDKEISLTPGTYTNRSNFVTMVNQRLAAEGVKATASLSGNRIVYTTTDKGSSASISMSYDSSSDSAMKAMYGTTDSTVPAVTASFDSENHLVLSSPGASLYVNSDYGSIFQKPKQNTSTTNPTKVAGHTSTVTPYVEGTSAINFPVTVNKYNTNLKFIYYTANGTSSQRHNGSVNIPQGTYNDIDSLVDAVKGALEAQSIPLDVSKSANGKNICFTAQGKGSNYNVNLSKSPFYNLVMSNATVTTSIQKPIDNKGSAPLDSAYVVGRKDIKNKPVKIEKGTNDELTLDMTINGNTTKLTMKLAEGTYQGSSLASMIQEKLDDALAEKGFDRGLINVAVGAKNTGVEGANDANALDFILNQKATFSTSAQPEGTYVLDGVGGSAAFYVFYQTDGEMIKAYAMGDKDLTKGVEFPEDSSLGFTVDGTSYELTIPKGKYSATEIKETLQSLAEEAGAPINFRLSDGKLKLEHKELGKHMITGISGSARSTLFFNEMKEKKKDNDVILQMSSETRDIEEITRRRVDTAAIGINGCCLTTIANARKTMGRLEEALHRMSDVRSYLGAKQNRLEHAIKINNNTSENTTAGESRIRDTDMALEMLRFSRANILGQVSQAMLTQANQHPQGVLRLLQ